MGAGAVPPAPPWPRPGPGPQFRDDIFHHHVDQRPHHYDNRSHYNLVLDHELVYDHVVDHNLVHHNLVHHNLDDHRQRGLKAPPARPVAAQASGPAYYHRPG